MVNDSLTRGNVKKTKIMAGHSILSIDQLEDEIKMGTEIGKKLKSIEEKLEDY